MCECCTPKEHLSHIHVHGATGTESIDKLNDAIRKLPGVFRAANSEDHGCTVITFDTRIIDAQTVERAVHDLGYHVDHH